MFTMLTTPSMEYQHAFRIVCSLLLYHICTTAMNVGAVRARISHDVTQNVKKIEH